VSKPAGVGIAGAMDYQPAAKRGWADALCCVCRGPFKGSASIAARIGPPLLQVCSEECQGKPPFAVEKTALLPRLGIDADDLVAEVERLIAQAIEERPNVGGVNWANLRVVDVEYRISMLDPSAGPSCVVMVEEASPDCRLGAWVGERLDRKRFPGLVVVECEW
jgi:hypothetical protein